MNKFTNWLVENTDFLSEASIKNLFDRTGTWPNHPKDTINGSDCPDIFPVIDYLRTRFDFILDFKYPKETTSKDISHGLYVVVDKAHASRALRKQIYKDILNDLTDFISINDKFVWLGDKEHAGNYSLITNGSDKPVKINLNSNILDKESPTDCVLYLGVYSNDDEDEDYNLESVVAIRIVGDTTTDKNYKCKIKDANSLLNLIFDGKMNIYNRLAKGENSIGLSLKEFQSKILSEVSSLIIEENNPEVNLYNEIFSKIPGKTFEPSKDWADIDVLDGLSLTKFLYNSNIDKVLAEILLPWLLTNGTEKICGIDILKKLNGNTNAKITNVEWPDGQNNALTDYSICFFNDGQKVGISAKAKDGGNSSTVISHIVSHLDDPIVKLTKDPLFKAITTNFKYCRENYKMSNMKYGWIMGATAMNPKLTSADLDSLMKSYEYLYNSKEILVTLPILIKEVELTPTIYKMYESLNKKYKNTYFTYSLTNIFEKEAVSILNKNDRTKGCIYKLKYNMFEEHSDMKFYQLELVPTPTGFNLKMYENKGNKKSYTLEQLGKLVKLEEKGVNGNTKKYTTGKEAVCILTQNGIGNGQIIGCVFSDK